MTVLHDPTTLRRRGFISFEASNVLGALGPPSQRHTHTEVIQAQAAQLEPDPYDPTGTRHRRYAQGVYLPWLGTYWWLPGVEVGGKVYTEYYQGSFNPDHDAPRRIARFDEEFLGSETLNALIRLDASFTEWHRGENLLPLSLGITMIKLAVDRSCRVSVASPNALHQDGETFTAAHLVTRNGVTGGGNVITGPEYAGLHPTKLSPNATRHHLTLVDVFDTYVIYDPAVSHHVNEVYLAPGHGWGERTILLIDFTPMRAEHHLRGS